MIHFPAWFQGWNTNPHTYKECVHCAVFANHLEMKEGNVFLFINALNTFYNFTVIWHQTRGKGPLRKRQGLISN